MKKVVLADHLVISQQELFSSLHMPFLPEEEDTQTILEMLKEAQAVARPKALYRVCSIVEKGEDFVQVEEVKIVSPLVRKNLEQANRVVAYVATCGTELEEWSRTYTDPLENYWADAIKMQFLALIRKKLTQEIREKFFPAGDLSVMSPGSLPSWPLLAQRTLFTLVGEVSELIGVTLTNSCLMLPSKSVSGIFFSSQIHYENCQYCPLLTCPGRRAPFRGEFAAEK